MRKNWTQEEDQKLRDGVARGDTYRAISEGIGRTPQATQARAFTLKLSKRRGKRSPKAPEKARKARHPRKPAQPIYADVRVDLTNGNELAGSFGLGATFEEALANAAQGFEGHVGGMHVRDRMGREQAFEAGDDVQELVASVRTFRLGAKTFAVRHLS